METVIIIVTALIVVGLTSAFKNIGGEWPHRVKALLATVVSLLAAGVVTVTTGIADGAELLPLAVQVYGVSQLVYHFIFYGTTAEGKLAELGADGNDHEPTVR